MRGRKNTDPHLVSEIDLLTLRPTLEAIAEGGPSSLSIMQLARLGEGVLEQNRNSLPKNERSKFEKAARTTIEHAIGIQSIIKGEQLTLLRMHEKKFVNTKNANRHLAEIDFVEAHYTMTAARQVAGMMLKIEQRKNSVGVGAGRRLGQFRPLEERDWALLNEALSRLTPERGSIDGWCEEIRAVVINAAASGALDKKGETSKENIDTHTRRLQRQARRIDGSSPKS